MRPSLDLIVVVTDADGNTKTLHSEASHPGDRPRGIQFNSQLGSGFYTASWSLSRAIDAEHVDIHLGDDVRIIAANGDTVWEGWISGLPRSMDTEHTVTVNCSGYMAHTADEPVSEIFVDRDLSRWGELSVAKRVSLMAAGFQPDGGSLTAAPDATGTPGLISSRPGVLNKTTNLYVYDAGPGNKIGRIYVGSQTLGNIGGTDPAFATQVLSWSNDNGGDEVATTVTAMTRFDVTRTVPQRYQVFYWLYNATGGTAGIDYSVRWQNVWVIGDHGISLNNRDVAGSPNPTGVYASDVIRWLIARYCPHLNADGVQNTTYPIAHLVAEETTVYDLFLKLNSFHLWSLAVWENRTLHFEQTDLTEWQWSVRHDEVGNQIGLQGDEFTELRNGVIVKFTDVTTGAQDRLHPDDYPELRDESIDNPANIHGRRLYNPPIALPWPTTRENALELGRIHLAEASQVKAPGSFTVTGSIRDRSGQLQPVSRVRSGDVIRLTSSASLSDRPRLIKEVSYDHSSRSATISVDSTRAVVEALLDRTATALAAAGYA